MKTLFLSLALLAVDGLTIPNSFVVDKDSQVYRGKEPKALVTELADIGITDVLIFKNELKTEVTTEIAALKELKIKSHHIPFRWKAFESTEVACTQVVEALNLIAKTKAKNGSIYFHCTAGEDRTGMLAGLYRMLEEDLSMQEVFTDEMCARGYSDGNKNKPAMVHAAIQKELTPLFIAIAQKIEEGNVELGKVSKTICRDLAVAPTKMTCKSIK
jgi:protein tyrosine/serine phosphatase